jgi:hypothetical protein
MPVAVTPQRVPAGHLPAHQARKPTAALGRRVFELWMLAAKELEETASRPLAATATRAGTMGSG